MEPLNNSLPILISPPSKNNPIHKLTELAIILIPYLNHTDLISFYLCNKLTKSVISQIIKFNILNLLSPKLEEPFQITPLTDLKFLKDLKGDPFSDENWIFVLDFYLRHQMVDEAIYFIKKNYNTCPLIGYEHISTFFLKQEKIIEALDYAHLIEVIPLRERQFFTILVKALDMGLLKEIFYIARQVTLPENQQKIQKHINEKMALNHLSVFNIKPYLEPLFLGKKQDRKSEKQKKLLTKAIQDYLKKYPLKNESFTIFQLNRQVSDQEKIYNALFIIYLNSNSFSKAIDITSLFPSLAVQGTMLINVISKIMEVHQLINIQFDYSLNKFDFINEEQKNAYNYFLEAYKIVKDSPSRKELKYPSFIERVKLNLYHSKNSNQSY